jgi:hypothetical protein
MSRIAASVAEKSHKLPRYIERAGPDVRLLVVADRYNNSGKLMLEDAVQLNRYGFEKVYFYSHPENVTVFD